MCRKYNISNITVTLENCKELFYYKTHNLNKE